MPTRRILFLLAPLVLVGCGSVGEPLPPTLDIPQRVSDLRVVERADKVLVDFTIPELTTEGLPLRLERVELRAGPFSREPFDPGAWLAESKLLDTTGLNSGPAHLELDASNWRDREVFFRVRLFSHKGRDSGWSEFASLHVIPPLPPPTGLTLEPTNNGISLNWTGISEPPGLAYRVLKRASKGQTSEVATTAEHQWLDQEAQFGETYEYSLQAFLRRGPSTVESAVSSPVTITPVDKFAPEPPKGLAALAGSSSIELTWEQSSESDLRGYRIHRATAGGAPESVGDLTEVPSYSDRAVQSGTRYRYSVSAVDRSGNESQLCKAVEISMP